jgi:hypothetical protein
MHIFFYFFELANIIKHTPTQEEYEQLRKKGIIRIYKATTKQTKPRKLPNTPKTSTKHYKQSSTKLHTSRAGRKKQYNQNTTTIRQQK